MTKADCNAKAVNPKSYELSPQTVRKVSMGTQSDEQVAQGEIEHEKQHHSLGSSDVGVRDYAGDLNEATKEVSLEGNLETDGRKGSVILEPIVNPHEQTSPFSHSSLSTKLENGQTSSTSLKVGDAADIRVSIDAEWCAGNVRAIYEDGSYRVQSTNGEYVTQKIGDCLRLSQRAPSQKNVAPIENDLPEREVNLLKAEGSSIEKSSDLSFAETELVLGSKAKVKHPKTDLDAQATIECAHEDGTFDIIFNDEERLTHVLADSIKPLSPPGASATNFRIGDLVECNFRGEGKWSAATISEVHSDGSYDLISNDGYREDNVESVNIRHRLAKQEGLDSDESFCQGDKVEASSKNPEPSLSCSKKSFCEGASVEARFKGRSKYYKGKISRARLNGTYDIDYDNGKKEIRVARKLIRALGTTSSDSDSSKGEENNFEIGTRVKSRYRGRTRYYKGKTRYYKGKISRARSNGTYDIDYDDGEKVKRVARELIRALDIISSDSDSDNDSGSNSAINSDYSAINSDYSAINSDYSDSNSDYSDSSENDFKIGTRVEARFKGRTRYYKGKISRARLNGTYDIDYDNGKKEIRVARKLIRALGTTSSDSDSSKGEENNFEIGTRVKSRYRGRTRYYKGKTRYYKGKISRARSNGTYDIDYDDGEKVKRVARELIRALDIISSDSDSDNDSGSNSAVNSDYSDSSENDFKIGTRVEAQFKGRTRYYKGKISRARLNGTYDVDYDNGKKEIRVARKLIRALGTTSSDSDSSKGEENNFEIGTRVKSRYRGRTRYYKGKTRYYKGKISRARSNGTYDIDYDDGEKVKRVARELIRALDIISSDSDSDNDSGSNSAINSDYSAINSDYSAINSDYSDSNSDYSDSSENDFKIGTRVEARYRGGTRYYKCRISRVRSNGTYDVDYDDGDKEKRVTREMIRALSTTSCGYDKETEKNFHVGSKVEALYNYGRAYYLGIITRRNADGTYDIAFDDGDTEQFVSSEKIRVAQEGDLLVGSKVEAYNKNTRRHYIGTIEEVQNTLYTIKFDDDKLQFKVPRETIGVLTDIYRIAEKSKVEVSFDNGKTTKRGTVDRVNIDDTYNIEFDDGGYEVRVDIQNIRLLRTTSSDYDEDTKKDFSIGSKVEALYKYGKAYYLGKISTINFNGTYNIAFDDGDSEQFVSSERIRAAQEGDLIVGSKVEARNEAKRGVYIGTITEVQNTLYTIKFDDGRVQFKVPRGTIGVLTGNERIAEKSKVEVSFDNGKTTKIGIINCANIDDTYNIEFDDGGRAVRVGVQNIIRVQESEQSAVSFNLDKPSCECSDSKQDLKTKSISQKRSHIQKSKQQDESESNLQNERESKQEDISEAKQQEALVENIHSMIQQMLSKMKDSEKSLNDEQKSRSETGSKRSEDDKVTAFRDKLSDFLTDKAESLLHNYLSKQESCDHLFDLGHKEEQRTENACNGCHIAYTTSDNAGMTMLMHAAERGHINVVQFLINHATMSGFNVYVNKKETKWGYSALMLAVKGGHVEIVGELLKHRLPFESLNINDRASKNSVTSQRYSKGANQNTDTTNIDSGGYRSNRNETALHIACALPEEQTNIVNYLCSHKALTYIADDTGFTPLHHACIRGHVAIVVLLLNLGANATIKTHEQVSPLHLAAQYGHERIVKLLLERVSLLVNTEDRKGQTALHLAFERYFYLSHLGWETVNHFKDQFEELIEIKTSGDNNSINQGRMGISDNPSSKELEKLHTSDPKVCKGGRQIVESKHFNELHFPVGVIEKVKLVLSQIRESDNSFDTLELPMLVDIQTRKILFNFVDSSNPISSEDISETKENVEISNNSQNSHVTNYVSGVTTTKGVGRLYPFYEHESADLLSFSELFDFVNKTENLQQIGTAWKSATKTLSGLGNLEQLFFAIDSQNFLIKSLLDAGADMSKEDNRGTSAFSKYTQSRWFATHEHEMERIHDAPLEAGHEAEVFLDKRTQYAVHQVWVSNGRRCYALWLLFMWIVGLLLLTWVALKYSGRDSYEAPSMQAAMRERISSDEWDEYEIKSLEDVESIAEWQQYLENVFVNALWETNQTYIDTEGRIQYIGNQGALLSGHLGLVGRPRYRQLRTRPDACLNENPSIIPQTEDFCFSPYTTRVYGSPLLSDEDRRNISCTLRNGTDLLLEWAEYQSYPVQGKYGYYRDGGFSIDLPSDYEEAISLLHDLGNCNFIDLNTRFAALEFTLYSRSQGLFTYGTVYLELTTTGMISPGQKWQTFKVVSYSTHQDLKDIWAEVLLGVFLLCYFASEVWSMLQPWPETRATKSLRASNGAITNQIVGSKYPVFWYPWIRKVEDQRSVARNKSTRFRKNWSVYLRKSSYIIPPYLYDGFNFVDVFVMVVVMSLISTHCLLVVQVNVAAPSWYELAASNMYIDVSHFLWLSAWRQYLLAITVFLFYIKTLEYLQVAPWLTIPILVIGGMLSRLAGFFAIFAVFIMAFGLFDYVLYGMEYEPVQSVWRGILGAFRASLGEVDFDGKIETDQTVGVVMSLAAASLLVILLLNLLIAIMNEAYEEIKETAEARWCYKQFSAYLAHQRRETMGFKFQLPFRYLHRLCCTKQELLKFNVVEDENNNNMIQVLAKSTRRSQVAPALE